LNIAKCERSEQEVEDLALYFKDHKLLNSPNEHFKVMGYECHKAGEIVMKYGEVGTKFYTILRGKVSVRIPCIVERNFEFKELLKLLRDNQAWVVHNERYDEIIKMAQELFPELVRFTKNGVFEINYSLLQKVLDNRVI